MRSLTQSMRCHRFLIRKSARPRPHRVHPRSPPTSASHYLSTAPPLAQYPLTLDDKFALMPRRVAVVYMNATKAYEVCQSREVNEPDCSGGKFSKEARDLAVKSLAVKLKARSLAMKSKAMSKDARRRMKAMYKGGKGRSSAESSAEGVPPQGRGRRLQTWTSPAYWATPQCVLKRHLMAHLPELRIFDCLRGEGSRGVVLRLVRPQMGRRL